LKNKWHPIGRHLFCNGVRVTGYEDSV